MRAGRAGLRAAAGVRAVLLPAATRHRAEEHRSRLGAGARDRTLAWWGRDPREPPRQRRARGVLGGRIKRGWTKVPSDWICLRCWRIGIKHPMNSSLLRRFGFTFVLAVLALMTTAVQAKDTP